MTIFQCPNQDKYGKQHNFVEAYCYNKYRTLQYFYCGYCKTIISIVPAPPEAPFDLKATNKIIGHQE